VSVVDKLCSIPELTKEYRSLAKAALVEHRDCLSQEDLKRFYFPWLASILRKQDVRPEARPWITFAAARFLSGILTSQSRVFEFGVGGSTLYFAQRVGELVTVEHDQEWLERTASKLRRRRGFDWKVHLEEPVAYDHSTELTAECGNAYSSTDQKVAGKSFKSYATSIERYDDNYFDVVLIDGRARVACFKHAVEKVKVDGHIVLDDAERPEYATVEQIARKLGFEIREFWGPGPYNRYFWRTIFMKRVAGRSGREDLDGEKQGGARGRL